MKARAKKNKKIKIYLAGAFSGWRDNVIASLSSYPIEFYDPRTDTDQSSICSFTTDDKNGVANSSAILCYAQEGHENVGLAWEAGIAVQAKVPLILVAEVDFIFPLLAGSALRIFTSIPPAMDYFAEWAKTGNELKAAYGAYYKSARG